jgi:tol-pal system protein YbgF
MLQTPTKYRPDELSKKRRRQSQMPLRTAFSIAAALSLGLGPANATEPPRFQQRFEVAQIYNRPPADMDVEPQERGDVANLTLRIDRLERELRQLTGRIEELQHEMQRLDEQARRAQPDASTPRPQSSGAPPAPPSPYPNASPAAANSPNAPLAQHRGDAFDPSRDPAAVGAPRPLGSTPPSAPLTASASPQTRTAASPSSASEAAFPMPRDPGAPLDLTHGRPNPDSPPPTIPPAASAPADASAALPPPPGPKDEYEVALSYLHKGQYETAEKGFAAFLAKNPKSRLAPAATFYLGETFFLRGRHREAAEKYLEVSAKYASSAQAPDALLRLGQSLIVLGAKEQACASFSEIGVKYPNAPPRTKEAAQRESKKVPC